MYFASLFFQNLKQAHGFLFFQVQLANVNNSAFTVQIPSLNSDFTDIDLFCYAPPSE